MYIGFLVWFFFACTTVDQRGGYLQEQMEKHGCRKEKPCNFVASGGPEAYRCTWTTPDASVLQEEKVQVFYGEYRPKYIIYADGRGEPDADVNRNDFFPPKAAPEMLSLQKETEALGCNLALAEGERMEDFSCVISTCNAWVADGKIIVKKK